MVSTAELTGQMALVTGAGRGLGRAIALRLAEAGAGVHMVDRDGDLVEGAAADLAAQGFKVFPHEADVTDEASLVWGWAADISSTSSTNSASTCKHLHIPETHFILHTLQARPEIYVAGLLNDPATQERIARGLHSLLHHGLEHARGNRADAR
jgi:nucleoside-diphosphate-sugar epimerase